MTTTEDIKARNIEKIESVINGDVGSVTVGGVVICRVHVIECAFYLETETLSVYGDELEISGCDACLKNDGVVIAIISLRKE